MRSIPIPSKITWRSIWQVFAWILLTLVILINLVAFNHARKFTHFDVSGLEKTKNPEELSLAEKLETLLLGISNPRPKNVFTPLSPYQTIRLESSRNIEIWQMKPSGEARGTVILFHGYGGSKGGMLDKAEEFIQLGYQAVLVDFYGSGGSEGNQTTVGYKEAQDVKAAYDYVQTLGEANIYLFGTSMGAAAILKALNDYALTPSGIILECPFGSLYQTTVNRFRLMQVPEVPFAGLLVFWQGVQNGYWAFSHNPVEYAKKERCPVLLMYGEKDNKVTKAETEAIYANLPEDKHLVTFSEAGHYLLKYKNEWCTAIAGFLK